MLLPYLIKKLNEIIAARLEVRQYWYWEGEYFIALMLSIHRIHSNAVYLEDGEMAVIDCINQ
jgi:hypothetical protein